MLGTIRGNKGCMHGAILANIPGNGKFDRYSGCTAKFLGLSPATSKLDRYAGQLPGGCVATALMAVVGISLPASDTAKCCMGTLHPPYATASSIDMLGSFQAGLAIDRHAG